MRALRTTWQAEINVLQLSALSESGHYGTVAVQDDPTLDLFNGQ